MNPAHLHLMLIHFPIASSFLALPVLAWALFRRAELGAIGAAAFVVAVGGVSAVLALETGEDAEEMVERLPGVSEEAIKEHEERAETAMVLSVATGLVGLVAAGAMGLGRIRLARAALGVALAADGATAAAMAWTGNAGGAIRHPEITNTGAAAADLGREGGGAWMVDDD